MLFFHNVNDDGLLNMYQQLLFN